MKTLYKHALLAIMLLVWAVPAMAQQTVQLGKTADVAGAYKARANAFRNTGRGNRISHTVPGQAALVLRVETSKKEGAAEVYMGEVEGKKSSTFFLKVRKEQLEGYVILKEQKKAYKYTSDANGSAYLQEVDINKVVCIEYREGPAGSSVAPVAGATAGTTAATELQSLPGAGAVVLLDFNGQNVKDTFWNNGAEINAAPSTLTAPEIIEAWKLISEDFRPFAINITTSEAVYLSAPANRRMRVVFTPTDFFYPGSGGVSYVGSFTWGNETPCWVFNSGAKYAGEAGSHEIGHTLGLSHDGRTSPAESYFYGQGTWAPIMGAGYYAEQVQWSKGEYVSANNLEDDLAIMSTQNGFGYRTDDHGNTNTSATPLVADNAGSVPATQMGVIGSSTDVDVFTFKTSGGDIELTAEPDLAYANLDVLLTLKNATNTTLAVSDPAGASASIAQSVPAGTYYVQVKGAKGAFGANSNYGSIGDYSLKAKFNPVVTAGSTARVNAGSGQFSDAQERVWGADAGFTGGTAGTKNFDMLGTTDDALYLKYRLAAAGAPFSYAIPVGADGLYTVKLHFVEPYFGAPGGKTSGLAGARVFHVDVEGQRVLSNYDIYSQDGAAKAVVKTFNVTVTGGAVNINFTSVVNNAIISAIEVLPVTYTLTTKVTGSGSLSKSPDQPSYASGKTVTLTAAPAAGYQFTGWSGSASGSANPLSVTMNSNKTITATFSLIQQQASLVSEIKATTGRSYIPAELVVGTKIYTDRVYQATSVPAFLNKAPLIVTANDDKSSTSTAMLSFKVSQPATVYVAYDPRATVLPAWLSGWQKLADRVGVNDSKISHMDLYSKSFAAGTVSLGGNLASPAKGAGNNYFVVVQAQTSAMVAISEANDVLLAGHDLAGDLALLAYPNPNAGDRVVVSLSNLHDKEAVTLLVQDVLGRLVATTTLESNGLGNATAEIPFSGRLNRGLYIITAQAGNRKMQSKLLVE